jgi:plasmid stability protein
MERLRERLYAGMAERGITGDVADEIFHKMKAFANYGFPESHSVSFAYLVYASSWIKYHEPAAFCAALINAQPMGFWSPHTLVQDARRHGVTVRTPDLERVAAAATLEDGGDAVRLGLVGARPRRELAERSRPSGASTARTRRRRISCGGCPSSRSPSSRRWRPPACSASASGSTGARRCGRSGRCRSRGPGRLPGIVTGERPPTLPGMTPVEESIADLWATGVSPDGHPTRFLRDRLAELGVATAADLWDVEPSSKVTRGRGGDPPAAADDRPGHHVPQPRGRDRSHQRGRVEGVLGPLPHRGPQRVGDGDPRSARAQRRGDQRRRRAPRTRCPSRHHPQPRLPLTVAVCMRNAWNYHERMKLLQIRNVPDDVHRRLKSRAALEGKSLSEFALAELQRSVEHPTRAEMIERLRSRSSVTAPEPADEAVRAERDAR